MVLKFTDKDNIVHDLCHAPDTSADTVKDRRFFLNAKVMEVLFQKVDGRIDNGHRIAQFMGSDAEK
jgi:hypothetical protein